MEIVVELQEDMAAIILSLERPEIIDIEKLNQYKVVVEGNLADSNGRLTGLQEDLNFITQQLNNEQLVLDSFNVSYQNALANLAQANLKIANNTGIIKNLFATADRYWITNANWLVNGVPVGVSSFQRKRFETWKAKLDEAQFQLNDANQIKQFAQIEVDNMLLARDEYQIENIEPLTIQKANKEIEINQLNAFIKTMEIALANINNRIGGITNV